ncbi:unnamed protein product [Amoebophrya sp. A120]|nr:unnamed protein product [Amoebophrya sp. A120]|eukprot:GSA120T00005207001.1
MRGKKAELRAERGPNTSRRPMCTRRQAARSLHFTMRSKIAPSPAPQPPTRMQFQFFALSRCTKRKAASESTNSVFALPTGTRVMRSRSPISSSLKRTIYFTKTIWARRC